jgi:hypothetical protein
VLRQVQALKKRHRSIKKKERKIEKGRFPKIIDPQTEG